MSTGKDFLIMILDEMKALAKLTVQETAVLTYITKNPAKVLGMSIVELAEASYTSTATIVRLCKKVGFKGYSDFKYSFASELPNIIELTSDLKVPAIKPDITFPEVFQRVESVHKRSIEYTNSLLDEETINKIAALINQSSRVEIYGEGLNYELARSFCLELEEVGCESNAYNSLNPMHTESFKNKDFPVLAFILTHTGSNEHMYNIAKNLFGKNYKTVVICDNDKRPICQLCDQTVVIMTTKGTLDLSNIVYISALQYFFDVLVTFKMLENYRQLQDISKEVEKEKEGKEC